MKYFKYIILIFMIYSCQTKDCKQWYTDLDLTPVTATNNGNEMIGNWYSTHFFNHEYNFAARLYYTRDGYEECKSVTEINKVVEDSIFLCCDNDIVIHNDTIKALENLSSYFKHSLTNGHLLLEYKNVENGIPSFERSENTFYIEVLLSDYKVIKDSCVVKIIR